MLRLSALGAQIIGSRDLSLFIVSVAHQVSILTLMMSQHVDIISSVRDSTEISLV